MSEYRYVSFYDLCRLCTAISENKTNIFSPEGKRKNLNVKISECVSILVDDKDQLPKTICNQCQQLLESFVEFRNVCQNSQNVLNSCLRTANLQNGGKIYIKDGSSNGKNLSIVNMQANPSNSTTITTNSLAVTPASTPTKYISDSQPIIQSQDFLSSIMQAVGIQQTNDNSNGKPHIIQQYTLTIPKEQSETPSSNSQSFTTFQSSGKQTKNNSLEEFLKMKPNLRVTPIKKTTPPKPLAEQQMETNQQQFQQTQQQQQQQKQQQFQLQLQQQLQQLQSQLQPNQQLTISTCDDSPKNKKTKLNFVLTSPNGQTLSTSVAQPQQQQQQVQYQTIQQQPQQLQLQIQHSQQPQLQFSNKQSQILPSATLTSLIAQPQQTQQQNQQTLISPSKCFLPITIKDENSDQQIIAHIDAKNFLLPTTYQLQMKLQPQIATADGQPIMQLTPTSIPATLQIAPQALSGQSFHDLCNQPQQTQPHQLQFQSIIQQTDNAPHQIVTAAGSIGVDAATSTNDQEPEQDNDNTEIVKLNTINFQTSQNQNVRNLPTILTQTTSAVAANNNQKQKLKVLKTAKTNSSFTIPRPAQQNVQQKIQQHQQQPQEPKPKQQEKQQQQKPSSVQHSGVTVHRIVAKNSTATTGPSRMPVLNKQNITINRVSTSQAQQNSQSATTQALPAPSGQDKQQLTNKKILATKPQPRNVIANTLPSVTSSGTTTTTIISNASKTTISAPAKTQSSSVSVNLPAPGPTGLDCSQCGRVFKKKEHLTQHLKLHTGHRPFKCTEIDCNKSFSRKEHLMRHIISHTGKKMFNCDMCQKLFSRKDNLNKHRRTHGQSDQTSNSSFVCEICKKTFVVKLYYEQHLKMHDKSSGSVSKTDKSNDKTSSEMSQQQQHKQQHQAQSQLRRQETQQHHHQQQTHQQQQSPQHHQQVQIAQEHQQSQSTTNHHQQVQIIQQHQHQQQQQQQQHHHHNHQLIQQQQIMHLQLPMVTTQDLAGNTITITQATDLNNPSNMKTIGNQESTMLNLSSSLANFVTLGPAQFVNATTGEIMGHIKIEK